MRLANATVERKGLKGEDASMLLLSSFLRPYFGYRTELLKDGKPIKGPKKHSTLVWYIVRESLRLTQHDATLASDLLTYAHQLIKTSYLYFYVTHAAIQQQVPAAAVGTASAADGIDAVTAPVLSSEQQLQLVTGNILRLAGASSSIALDLADVILEQQLRQQQQSSARPSIPLSASCAFDSALGVPLEWADANGVAVSLDFLRSYRAWIEKRSNLLQLQVWKMTPLVAGTDPQLCALLGIPTKGGPHIGQIVNRMIEWQILNADKLLAAKNAMVTANAAANAAAAATPPAPEAAAAAASAAASAPAASSPAPAAAAVQHHHHSHTPHSSHVLVVDDTLKAECFAWVARYKHTFEVAERKGASKK
jgi:hypothetical protein